MGAVWEAEDEVLTRRVAVKILAQPLCDNEAVAERFRREAQAAGRLPSARPTGTRSTTRTERRRRSAMCAGSNAWG
jgi:serine/threonine protein kinase